MFRLTHLYVYISVLEEKRLYFVLIWNTSGRIKLSEEESIEKIRKGLTAVDPGI